MRIKGDETRPSRFQMVPTADNSVSFNWQDTGDEQRSTLVVTLMLMLMASPQNNQFFVIAMAYPS